MPSKFSWNFFPAEFVKSVRIGARRWLVLLACLFSSGAETQTLDWWNDMTVFGTTANEQRPVLVMSPSGSRLRLLCVRSDSSLCSKVSSDDGSSWSASADSVFSVTGLQTDGTADADYHYLLIGANASSMKTLFRLDQAANSFRTAFSTTIAPGHTGHVRGFDIVTDAAYQPGNPYLNVVWIEDVSAGNRALCFAQSRNRAVDFLPETEIARFAAVNGSDSSVSVCSAWQFGHEYLLSAIAVDRSGSAPEEVRMYRSTDQGSTWTAVTGIDATASSQTQPTLAAYGSTVLLAYTHGAVPVARDIRLAFSLDGGATFSAPQTIVGSADDEHSPHLLIDNSGVTFSLVYFAGNPAADSATVMVCSGLVAAPWQAVVPVAISEPGAATTAGGLSAAICARGAAVAWTSRFVSGDFDVRFDASWRGSSARERMEILPMHGSLCKVYPNPFNSSANVQLVMDRSAPLVLTVTDLLGRVIRRNDYGNRPAGVQIVPLDFAGLSSGTYFIRLENSPAPAQRVLLLR